MPEDKNTVPRKSGSVGGAPPYILTNLLLNPRKSYGQRYNALGVIPVLHDFPGTVENAYYSGHGNENLG